MLEGSSPVGYPAKAGVNVGAKLDPELVYEDAGCARHENSSEESLF